MLLIITAEMETQVMKHGKYTILFEICQQLSTFVKITTYEIEHVAVVSGIAAIMYFHKDFSLYDSYKKHDAIPKRKPDMDPTHITMPCNIDKKQPMKIHKGYRVNSFKSRHVK